MLRNVTASWSDLPTCYGDDLLGPSSAFEEPEHVGAAGEHMVDAASQMIMPGSMRHRPAAR